VGGGCGGAGPAAPPPPPPPPPTEPWKALRAAIYTARLKSGPDTNLIAAIRDGNSVGDGSRSL